MVEAVLMQRAGSAALRFTYLHLLHQLKHLLRWQAGYCSADGLGGIFRIDRVPVRGLYDGCACAQACNRVCDLVLQCGLAVFNRLTRREAPCRYRKGEAVKMGRLSGRENRAEPIHPSAKLLATLLGAGQLHEVSTLPTSQKRHAL